MVCVASDAGVVLRPNSSLAGVAGIVWVCQRGQWLGIDAAQVLRRRKICREQRECKQKCDAPRKPADPCFHARYFHNQM